MIEEFLYVQSSVEQIISISVALRCVKALGIWKRKKDEDALSDIKHLTKTVLNLK